MRCYINIPSSAKTPSGFSVKQARQFAHYFGQHENASYLHICEAAPSKKTETKVGKLITYLITDFKTNFKKNNNNDFLFNLTDYPDVEVIDLR